MDNNNWRAAQGQMAQGQVGGGEVSAVPNVATPAAMDAGDWRTQFQAVHRQRIVNKIMDTLRRHLPFSGHEGLQEFAIRFEEQIYAVATSQSDYLRKISLKMLTLETRSQNPMASSLPPNAAIIGPMPPDQALDAGAWRTQLQAAHRQRIVNKIMDTLKRHLPFSGHEGLQEFAIRFEEQIYAVATSQSDYLRKISLKMLTLETRSQNPMASSLQPNPAITGPMPPDQALDAGDWRTQLQAAHRQRIVNKIMDTLRRHLPFSGHEGLQEFAIRFEEQIYAVATSQSDYLRKISLKMLTLETRSQNPMASSLQPNAAITGPTPPDQALEDLLDRLVIQEDDETSR